MGCDLIILQKNEGKEELSEEDKRLGDVVKNNHTGISTNGYFFDHPEYIIHTDAKRDTDPYGKPAMVYTHSGGVEGIATDLYRILSADLSARLDLERYNGVKGERQEPRQAIVVQPAQAEAKKGNDIRQVAGQEAELKRENNIKTAAGQGTEVKKENALTDTGEQTETKREGNPVQPMRAVAQGAETKQHEAPVMDLYDLFGYTQEERRLAERGLKPEEPSPNAGSRCNRHCSRCLLTGSG